MNKEGRTVARRWHKADVVLHFAILTYAIIGLIGHYKLASREDAIIEVINELKQ